jgi:hypothetical protein
MKKTIYASIEDALKLKEAGFEKECVHHAIICTEDVIDMTISICAYDFIIDSLENSDMIPIHKKLWLPTLEEIDLPEDIFVIRNIEKWKVLDYSLAPSAVDIENNYHFATELEARAEAWIWAYGKKEVGNA